MGRPRGRGRHRRAETQPHPRRAKIVQQMYDETGPDGRRRHTVAQIAAELGYPPSPSTAPHQAPAPTPG